MKEDNKKDKRAKSPKRTRNLEPKISLSDYLRKHSPLKAGLELKDQDRPLSKWNKITDKIYLGNYQAANDRKFMKEHKIKAVLNCTKDVPNHFANNRDIEYMRIPVEDSLKEKDFDLMYNYMPCIVEFITKHADIQKNKILIHCVAGRQRSAIAVAAYLVCKNGLNPHEACKLILEKRPEGFHHGLSLNFDQALDKYYKDLTRTKK